MPSDPHTLPSHALPSKEAEHLFDPTLDKLEVKKQTRRALLLIFSIFATLVITFVGVFLFYDVPMPDDSSLLITDQELRPPPASSPTAGNPLADLVQALKATNLNRADQLQSKARSLEPGTEAEVRTFLATQGPAFAAYDTLLHQTQPDDWRWPELGTEPPINWTGESVSWIQNIAFLIRLRSRLELADGRWEKSLHSLTSLIQFGAALQRRPGTFIHHLVASTTQRLGESGLEAALTLQPVPADRLGELQQQLTALEPDRANYERTLRIEYRCFKETLHLMADATDLSSHHGTKLLEPIAPLLLKPGMTCTVRSQHDQAVIAALQHGWKEGLRQQKALTDEYQVQIQPLTHRLLSANPVGDYHHLQYTGNAKIIFTRNLIDVTLHRQTLLQLALRRYQLDQGRLPDDLAVLVPQYLPEVPLDPFTDLPMKWLPATQIIYSIGVDLMDNGGSFTKPADRREPDLGMRYWWGPSAEKWREEERLKSLPTPKRLKKKTPKSNTP